MTDDRPEVLLAGLDDATALRVVKVLEPLGVRFQRAPWWSAVAGVATGTRFEVVIVALPDDVANLASMIREVRMSTSRSRQAALLVVTGRDRMDEAVPLVGGGVNRVVVDDQIERELSGAVAHLLDIAPRFRVDRTARIVVTGKDGLEEEAVVTADNISTSGMLVVGAVGVAPGATVGFELDAEDGPVRGRARVIWQSPAGDGSERRFGMRFEEVAAEDRRRLDALLTGLSN
jgi:hypothetical protein